MVKIAKDDVKHPLIDIFERLESTWLEHEGSHKIIVDGITIESTDKRTNKGKVIKIIGDLKLSVASKNK